MQKIRMTALSRFGWAAAIAALLTFMMADGAMAEAPDNAARGPGAVFASVDAAALDALKFAHRALAQSNGRGGAIFATEGGFSYGDLVRATSRSGFELTLGPDDVAWFYAHNYELPVVGGGHMRVPTKADRSMVSQVDPHHRPLYLLTSRMTVLRYDGIDTDVIVPGRVTVGDVIAAN